MVFGTTDLKKVSPTQILLSIGGLITVIGIVSFIALNWQGWNTPIRLLAIFLPMALLYIGGYYLWTKDEVKERSTTLLVTASLIFPLFLVILFREYKIFDSLDKVETFKNTALTISLITTLAYLLQVFIYKHASWTLLSGIAFLSFTFSFLGKFVPDETLFTSRIIAWSFLLVGSLYVVIGYVLEQQKKIQHCKYPYLLGFAVAYFSIASLGNSGAFLNPFSSPQDSNYRLNGLSSSIGGLIYLAIAYLADRSKSSNFENLPKYAGFFNLVGAGNVIGGFFAESLGGKKLVYEMIVLALSLLFIFTSTLRNSKAFLYVGAIYLVVFIFDIGAEYFQDKVGWPITLVVTGLLSMGVALLVQKMRGETNKAVAPAKRQKE